MTQRMFDVTLVTHSGLPDGAPDDVLLAEALHKQGLAVRLHPWDDPKVDWSLSRVTVVRSTWNYHRHPEAWRRWVAQVGEVSRLVNPPEILLWNMDKRYLEELAAKGLACVSTRFVRPPSTGASDLAALVAARGWTDVVVKPTIAASASGAARFRGSEIEHSGAQHLNDLLATGDAMVQPYIKSVEQERERSLVFVDGTFAHSFTKPAFNANASGTSSFGVHHPTGVELALAESAIAAAPSRPLYARVDLIPTDRGPLLMELELIEPDLGLRLHAPAATQFAMSIHTLIQHGY